MSGHSHWATTKRGKATEDAKKSMAFTKVSRLLTVAAKQGGGDPDSNPSLRLAIEKAKEARMPKENIQKAIDKGLGRLDSGSYEEITYEGFGPEGVAFIVKVLTDNRNRTASEMRNIFTRYDGSLGGVGSTAYIFSPDPKNPSFYAEILNPKTKDRLEQMLSEFDDNDDVQEVFYNFKLVNN
ncbi:MAG: hypothetical protein ACD_24C00213G0011 [uncultured bacterium]|nr:MAG: hypothetical protein ACD_24C00213G0011 [uncultured bacterium]